MMGAVLNGEESRQAQQDRDAHAGNTHEAVTQQYLDDWSVESQLELARESIDWEAHKRFMRGL